MAAWIAAAVLIIVVVVVSSAALLFHNNSFQNYALNMVEQNVSAVLGARVQVNNFSVHLSTLSLDMNGVTVYGAEPYPTPPLLQVDHISFGVRIVSVLQRKWYLDKITVDHPVLQVLVNEQGVDNLPKPKSSGQSQTSVFDLAIRHALLNHGELYYNNRKSAFDADLRDLSLQTAFDTTRRQYSGSMGYREGHIEFGNFNPLVHDLETRFVATPERFTLERAVLTSGQSQLTLSATLENYSQPRVQANYSATLDAGELRHVVKNYSLPVGIVRVAGSMQYRNEANQPFIDALKIDGELSSRALQVQAQKFRSEIANIGARYRLSNGTLDINGMRAGLLGGDFAGSMTIRDIGGASRSRLHATLRGLSVGQLKSQLNSIMTSPSLRQAALGGTVSLETDATWGKTLNDLVAQTDATIQTSVAPLPNANNSVPVNGVIHAHYAAAKKQIDLVQSYLQTPQTSLTMNGTAGDRSNLQLGLDSKDLHELDAILSMFRTPTPGQPVQLLGVSGPASFTGVVRGSTKTPQLSGQISAANLRVKGSTLRLLRTNINIGPSLASLQNGEIRPANRGRITFNLSAGLRNWSFTDTSPINVVLDASLLDLAEIVKAGGYQLPAAGTISAEVSVHGSELNPIGQGTVSLSQAKIYNEPIQSANLKFFGTGDNLHGNLALHMIAGSAKSEFTYLPKQKSYQAKLRAAGIRLDQLQTLQARNLQLTGVLNLDASGQGTLSNPELTATVQVPKLQVQKETLSGLTLRANVANHVANLALDSQAANTSVRARGTVNLTGDYLANANLDTQVIPLQPLLAVYAPSLAADVYGQTEVHASLRGPLKNKSLIDAHATIPRLQLKYKNAVELGAASPIQIDFTKGVLAVQRATIRGTDTDLQFQGTIPTGNTAPASLLLLGTVNLQLAQLLYPDIASSGQLRFNINSYGSTADPDVKGEIEIVNANLATGSAPIGLQNGNGILSLTKDRLNITKFNGTVGGGAVTMRGGVAYRPSLQFNLALSGQGIRVLYPESVRQQLDANLNIAGTPDSAVLGGQVHVNRLSFTPDFDLSTFISQFTGVAPPAPAQGFTRNVQLNVDLESTSGVSLVSRALSLQASANLQVRGTAAEPVLLGRANVNSGDLIFRGNRYILQGGTVDFINPLRTEPIMNVTANTTIQEYNIQIQFQGTLDHLRTNYTSDPALPPADIINLVAFGKTTEATAANPTPAGNLGAQSLIASGVSSQVTSRVEKIAGISQFSVDPVLGSSQQNPGARVTIQQRVTSGLFVTFATDVTSTQRQVIQLQYQVSPRVSFSSTRDQNGGFGFDVRIRKSW